MEFRFEEGDIVTLALVPPGMERFRVVGRGKDDQGNVYLAKCMQGPKGWGSIASFREHELVRVVGLPGGFEQNAR